VLVVAVCLAIAILAFATQRDARLVFFMAVTTLPWFGVDVDIGLRITPYLICIAALSLGLLPAVFRGHREKSVIAPLLAAFIIYCIARSALQIPLLPYASVEGGSLRAPVPRALALMLMLLLLFAPAYVGPMVVKSLEDLYKVGRLYIISCIVLAALGWVQLAVWITSGSNPFPIGLVSSLLGGDQTITREGIFVASGGELVYRMNSFGGEPKDLGRSLAIAAVTLHSAMIWKMVNASKVSRAAFWFLAISTLATFSTSAFAIFLVGIGVSWTTRAFIGEHGSHASRLQNALTLVGAITFALLAAFYFTMSSEFNTDEVTLGELIRARTVERETYIEDFDEAIVEYLSEHPLDAMLGVGVGNIHLYADEYLDAAVAEYAGGTAFSGKHGIVRLASDVGIVGISLFLLGIASLLVAARKSVRQCGSNETIGRAAALMQSLVVTVLLLYLMNTGAASHLFILVGLLGTLIKLCRGSSKVTSFKFDVAGVPIQRRTPSS
jgi:hypothetical protein